MTTDSAAAEIVDTLVAAYGLQGEPHDIHVFRPRHEHVIGFSVGSQRYIAKTGWTGVFDSDTSFKFDLQRYLHEIGYPIPAVLRTVEGDVVWDRNDLGAFVVEWVGEPFDPRRRPKQCDTCAAA